MRQGLVEHLMPDFEHPVTQLFANVVQPVAVDLRQLRIPDPHQPFKQFAGPAQGILVAPGGGDSRLLEKALPGSQNEADQRLG